VQTVKVNPLAQDMGGGLKGLPQWAVWQFSVRPNFDGKSKINDAFNKNV